MSSNQEKIDKLYPVKRAKQPADTLLSESANRKKPTPKAKRDDATSLYGKGK